MIETVRHLNIEFSNGEERYQREPVDDDMPERIFERRAALSVLDRVVQRLRDEFVRHGCPEHFERLKTFLRDQSDAPYAALAHEMNTSEGALKVAVHRLQKRYRELIRQEIADTKGSCRYGIGVAIPDSRAREEVAIREILSRCWSP